jgi:hypothetical protein
MERRDFLKKVSGAAIGGALYFSLGRNRADADDLPWEERTDSILLSKEGEFSLSPMFPVAKGIKNEYPDLAITKNGGIAVVYASERKDGEAVFLREFKPDGTGGEEIQLSTHAGFESRPRLVAQDNTLYIVWAARREGKSSIIYRPLKNGAPGNELIISPDASSCRKPCLVLDKTGIPIIAWECMEKGHYVVKVRRLGSDNILTVGKDDRDNCRPAMCVAPDGTVWLTWDAYDGPGDFNIYLKNISVPESADIRVSNHPASDLAPAIAADKEGFIWVAWHSNKKGVNGWDIPRWFDTLAFKDGQLYEPVSQSLDKNLEKEGENQSLEFMQILCAPDGRLILTGRPSHNFCLQWYKGDAWSRLYRLPKDGWGGRGQHMRAVMSSEGVLWVARRDLDLCVLQCLSGLKGEYVKPALKPIPAFGAVPALVGIEKRHRFPEWNGNKYYFGDIHAHTWMSDGVGDLDEFYTQRRDLLRDDFACLTDHDTFVGNSIMPSEWEEQKEMVTHYNEPGRFITLYGQEWTTLRWPRQFGHKNIYHIDPAMPLLDHTDDETNTSQKLLERAKKVGAICIPHHIGWTGVDWENHDPSVQPLVEIVSNHGAYEFMNNRPIFHRGGIKGCFIQDGLARGLVFGIVGGSDTHGLLWQHHVGWKRNCLRVGLTCILAKELTREALFDAMKNRRTYATSGVKMCIIFEVENAMIGQEVSLSKPPRIRVEVMSPLDVQWLQIVRNNETILTYGGEGFHTRFTHTDEGLKSGRYWYYLRVITEDGNMAWTSPIWVNYA